MKLISKSTDTGDLYVLKDLLEANGIPAFINGENTARMFTPFLMTEPSLWIYLDEQFDEAVRLLKNPDYEVINKVDMDEFYGEAKNFVDKPANLNTALISLAFTMGLILLGMIMLIQILQWMAT